MNKTAPRMGEAIAFSNTCENATSFEWDFGDGNSSTERNTTHSYSSAGTFVITLTASGKGGSGSQTKSITVGDPVLELTFYGDSYKFEGPTSFKAGPIEFHFYNQSSGRASANLVKHDDGYSHQDSRDLFVNGYCECPPDSRTTVVQGVLRSIGTNNSHTWTGELGAGLYTLVSFKENPLGVWYGAGLTVNN